MHGIDISYAPVVTATVSGSAVDAAGRPIAGTASLAIRRPVRVTAPVGATLEGRVVIEGPPALNIAGLTVSIAPADFDYTPPERPRAMFAREDDGTGISADDATFLRRVAWATVREY